MRQRTSLFPVAEFDTVDVAMANRLLEGWEHKMGPINRPMGLELCHVLYQEGKPVALTVTSDLVAETVGGANHLNRSNCVELSRVCAQRPGLCRVVLRLWREMVFPGLGKPYAISYQDAVLHSGDLYRFDGWERISYSSSGTDKRSGRKGRRKWVWQWPKGGAS